MKAARLLSHQTLMTHAMLFTGVDVVDGKPRRWRVENSWGDENGRKGFYTMNDSWFDQHMFEIAARRSAVNARLIRSKAAFLDDVPELNTFRLQAFGTLLQRLPGLLRLEEAPPAPGEEAPRYNWLLMAEPGGPALLRSPEAPFDAEDKAIAAAEEAAVLAAREALYENVHVGGGFRRYVLRDDVSPGARVVAESPSGRCSNPRWTADTSDSILESVDSPMKQQPFSSRFYAPALVMAATAILAMMSCSASQGVLPIE